ncbi:MAG: helix-hairpin-helix domain-containing protein [Oscillospiraceae bacterium]|jgi:hypothetical protein|nr:helix-hairpin-helix domain-containing protein [Oscillospiraceae bacterium]
MSDLTKIPGIGRNMDQHLKNIGFATIASLAGQNPQELYERDCAYQGCSVDRCVLYVYRLAVYYAEHNGELPPDKQNWWDWKE